MRVSLALWAVCLVAAMATAFVPGLQDFGLIAVALLVGSALLVLRESPRPRPPTAPERQLVIDGSNVMHWRDATPQIETLRQVVAEVTARGFRAGVIFDANAGHKLENRYLDDGDFARRLGLSADQVLVVARGQPADPVILAAARENGASIVTNDRYRDWADDFPEVAMPGHLVRGGFRQGRLWLDDDALDAPARPSAPLAAAR